MKIITCYCCSVTKSCTTLSDPMDCSRPGSSVLHYLLELLKFMSIELVMLSNHLTFCHPLLLPLLLFLPSIFLASGSFPMSWLFPSGGQTIGASALASALPTNIKGWFPLGLTGFISLWSKGLLRVFSSTIIEKLKKTILRLSLLYGPAPTSVHDYWKNHSFDYTDLCQQSDVSAF